MGVNGISSLRYHVEDAGECTRFFEDFGLVRANASSSQVVFALDEGSTVQLHDHGCHIQGSSIEGDGVAEVVWGVDNAESLERLARDLGRDHRIEAGPDGALHFVPPFGIPMALKVYPKRTVEYAPDPLNAPGHIGRLNTHRKWRKRARPKVIQHVVFQVPDYEASTRFMIERLNFRTTDIQQGFGIYLRAPGTINHHNLLLLNAHAPLPGLDGKTRFHHANFGVEDLDEIMLGANHMVRCGWPASDLGLGRHRIDSALFYYLHSPAGGEVEYGTDGDFVDDNWVPRRWTLPLFGYAQFVHNLPPFLMNAPEWRFEYADQSG